MSCPQLVRRTANMWTSLINLPRTAALTSCRRPRRALSIAQRHSCSCRNHSTTLPLNASLAVHPCHASAGFAHNIPYPHPQPFIPPPLPRQEQQQQQQQQGEEQHEKEQSTTFYRRELPPHLHSFTSPAGRALFKECVQAGQAEIYFSLSGNFVMQSEPAFCGLGSLAMVLNALAVDPGKRWKGVWRWYSDDMLECCAPLTQIRQKGMTFRELACLARCNGLRVVAKRADQVSREEFLNDLRTVTASEDTHMVVSFSRATLSQTGDGHFSPIGAYHPEKNQALVLDTARFKYPSYFCDANLLYEAMQPIDKETGLPRGYFILTKGESQPISLLKLHQNIDWPRLNRLFCHDLPQSFSLMEHLEPSDIIQHILSSLPADNGFLISLQHPGIDLAGPSDELATTHAVQIQRLLTETVAHPMFTLVKRAVESSHLASHSHTDGSLALATILLLAAPRELFVTLSPKCVNQLSAARDVKSMTPLVRSEVERITEQLEVMLNRNCQCGKRGMCGIHNV
ncbi:uncharacterized protein SPPG_02694 [Spizellomyces punctatus DAOM BR117]|uniref:glutathione gamma-glutamylcysteinyltransferase n=1 Tax=Spizellomyces punctatus (strain DAOM BR117) TaxID=645134 RepID=A0A0L0HN19_SPIPD|nr:uncharacterized protein SPPG_02694 [Spizellomyces punctatus DAOM BR117]KND02209.1 hypothetical protein SPPG_02694 [Spizellomyces punctatus DAOM BR117]|eukprot:XP_016610248.1 hypothetical protein SPPG_02694 [Spizellomyces punctatus DAOM BR117]